MNEKGQTKRGTTADDKRKLKRRHLIYYLKIFDQRKGSLLGHLGDITFRGILLVSEKTIKIDKVFHLKMELPNKKAENFKFDAVCRWCKRDINPDLFASGFEFLDLSPETIGKIRTLISSLGFQD